MSCGPVHLAVILAFEIDPSIQRTDMYNVLNDKVRHTVLQSMECHPSRGKKEGTWNLLAAISGRVYNGHTRGGRVPKNASRSQPVAQANKTPYDIVWCAAADAVHCQ